MIVFVVSTSSIWKTALRKHFTKVGTFSKLKLAAYGWSILALLTATVGNLEIKRKAINAVHLCKSYMLREAPPLFFPKGSQFVQ